MARFEKLRVDSDQPTPALLAHRPDNQVVKVGVQKGGLVRVRIDYTFPTEFLKKQLESYRQRAAEEAGKPNGSMLGYYEKHAASYAEDLKKREAVEALHAPLRLLPQLYL